MAEYLIQSESLTAIADAVRAKTEKTDRILLSNFASEITNISTGVELGFEVVGGTTEPASPSENMIWVNTDAEITSWIFSATQTETTAEGMVWFKTALASPAEFNALKKNSVMVYPIATKQYVSGAWVSKTAKIYQDSTWEDVLSTIYLFKSGTGNLVDFTKKLSHSTSGYACTITPSNITASSYVNDGEAGYVSFYTTSKVDLTGYSTLYFDVKVTKAWDGEEPTFGVASATIPASEIGINKFTAKKSLAVSSRKTISVDITNIDSGYVGAWAVGNFIVYNIWYE